MIKSILLIIALSIPCIASFEEYQIGFQNGFKQVSEKALIVPVPVMKPVTPAGMTDLEFGRRMGMAYAYKRIYERLNSWERKMYRNK